MKERTYNFGGSTLTLKFGDITKTNTQVIVSSDDYYLSMGGGVSASILKAGGNEIALDGAKKVPAKLGDVVITTAGRLRSKFVFHAITIAENIKDPREVIKSATRKCLELMNLLGLTSISFPTIGVGAAGFEYDDVAAEMSQIISEYLHQAQTKQEVIIYLFDRFGQMQPTDYITFFEAFATKAPNITKKEIKKLVKEDSPQTNIEVQASGTEQEIKAKRLHNLRGILGTLEDQRNRLEQKLIELIENTDNKEYKKIKEKLKENEDLRLSRLKELDDLTGGNVRPQSKSTTPTVFVSSTYRDLIEHRKAIKEQISRRKMIFIGMEHFGANPDNHPPASVIVEEVKKTDVYIGVFGVRYGYVDPATGLSMTELEYREAKATNKPMLLYIIKDTANIKVSDIEEDGTGREKLKDLKKEILANKVVFQFDTVADLERQVFEDLGRLKLDAS